MQCIDDEGRGIVRPWNDVDLFALHFLHDSLNAATLHADTCTDRVDRTIIADNADLCTASGIARGSLDFDNAIVNFRHFLREQLFHEVRMRAAQQDLRSPIFALHLHDQRPYTITIANDFTRNLLVAANNAFCPAKIDNDVTELDRFHDTGDDFARTVFEFLELALALCVADLLEYNLLSRLGIDAAKIDRWQRIDDEVTDHSSLLQLVGLF